MARTLMPKISLVLMMVSMVPWKVCAQQQIGLNITSVTSTTTPAPNTTNENVTAMHHRCILLIGGTHLGPSIEYYHPTTGKCNVNAIGRMPTSRISGTDSTAGCYLSDTQQIVIREERTPEKPLILYGLRDCSANQLPLPYEDSNGSPAYTWLTTAAAVSPSKCFSCGGWNRSWLALAECFQFDSSSPTNWTDIPPLPRRLAFSASVSMGNNSYYIIGGSEGSDYVSRSKQLFRYSISERRWYEETPMAELRKGPSAAALSATEFIVCGGVLGRNDCEVYNTMEKEWHRVGNLTIGRQMFAMVKFDSSVYALGGLDSDYVWLDLVEEYDVVTEEWTVVKKLKYARKHFIAVVV